MEGSTQIAVKPPRLGVSGRRHVPAGNTLGTNEHLRSAL